jgi:hypothetical protein
MPVKTYAELLDLQKKFTAQFAEQTQLVSSGKPPFTTSLIDSKRNELAVARSAVESSRQHLQRQQEYVAKLEDELANIEKAQDASKLTAPPEPKSTPSGRGGVSSRLRPARRRSRGHN